MALAPALRVIRSEASDDHELAQDSRSPRGDVICRTARELDADLIVIGSHGYGGIDRVLATTAARVVNHADRSVLVARPRMAA